MSASYWPDADEQPLRQAYWDDPCPEWQGMLSSDLIAFYNAEVGGMIGPWNEGLLKPASYELTLGPNCLVNGVIRTLSEDDPWLELPYNSIVFVSMGQWVRLPHYLAARFDLAIEYIYQGILLGTGPQVDPGFQGILSCPLHNISSDSVHMRLGDPFAKMDFAKTSGLAKSKRSTDLRKISGEDDLYAAYLAGRLPGTGGAPVKLFNHSKRWRDPIFAPGYAGQKLVKSSVKRLEDDVVKSRTQIEEFDDEIRRIRRFGIATFVGVLIAIASLLLALAQLDRSYTDAKVDQSTKRIQTTSSARNAAIGALSPRLIRAERDLARLRKQLAELRARLQRQLGP
jgi:deoxycytidine triphosphate deaminase